ncbi:MAG: hypothetical protein D6707_11045 [Bacteroidetes bacterium]|nr:MAG: hypothetical protein D6707_11045 [Bacteroidota bacterium]
MRFHWAYVLFSFILVSFTTPIFAPDETEENSLEFKTDSNSYISFLQQRDEWVDSLMSHMSLDEKIGQLFMIAAYSNKNAQHKKEIERLIKDYHIGGLIFFQGGPVRQANLTNYFQSVSKVPLLIAMDAEWGLAMRLDSTIKYPRQIALGAIPHDTLIYQMGADIAEQCKRLGVHINFAPVVDVNNNPSNPVINSRSFGENKKNVAAKGIAYAKGMQNNGVLAVAKHFPGHGDTDTDSHKDLPVIPYPRYRLENLEFYPFRNLIEHGVGGVMVAHLYIPALDSTPNQAATLSKKIVTGLLKEEMGFQGLTFTDALNMKGVTKYYPPGIADVKALLAGNDVLLFSQNVPVAVREIKKAIQKGEITEEEINQRVRKILMTKKWAGLDKYQPVNTQNLIEDLNQRKYLVNKRRLAENAITLVHNHENILPLKKLDTLKIASLSIGSSEKTVYQNTMDLYAEVTHFNISKTPSSAEIDTIVAKLAKFDVVLVGIHHTSQSPRKNFGITKEEIDLLNTLKKQTKTIVSVFGNPYILGRFRGIETTEAILVAYEEMGEFQEYAAQLIFGGIKARGKLPVSASDLFLVGKGLETTENFRLKYSIPEDLNIQENDLNEIAEIIEEGIKDKAFPGCQMLIAKNNTVFYHKAFGYHTYEKKKPVSNNDIYDLASITKVAASTVTLMRLHDLGLISLDGKLEEYIPEWVDSTEYADLSLREILAHQAGLVSWIPFYKSTLVDGMPRYDIYSMAQCPPYTNQVADKLFIIEDYRDEIIRRIVSTPLKDRGQYRYSDLGYYLIQRIIEKKTGKQLNEFVDSAFYRPMGMVTTGYLPLKRFPKKRIVPTEYDVTFRKQQIHGYVHDPGAAMLGGVGGHAGVFSNANDLAKLFQMLLNKGVYGGDRYLSAEVIEEFTRCQFCVDSLPESNRRAAGFDKPVRNGSGGPTCQCVSLESFGHTGFTGTISWADPEEQLIYIFLSNRIYPSAKNRKLITGGYRTRIMEVIYNAIDKSKAHS